MRIMSRDAKEKILSRLKKEKTLRFVWIEHTTFRYQFPKFDFSLTLSQLS